MQPEIKYEAHGETEDQLCNFFPGLTAHHLPDREGWANEWIKLTTHNGTHVDAPWHYHSTMDGGKRAITIDEGPLEWCFQHGVKFDFRHFADGYVVSAADIEAELAGIGHTLGALDIVLVNTAAGMSYGDDDYVSRGCGFAALTAGAGMPRSIHTKARWEETGDPDIIWEGHKAGRDIGYGQIEKLRNLAVLPDFGFMVSCSPVKIKGASAGWTRAVAIFDE